MFERSIKKRLEIALKISPCVLLSGARQVGKSTLSLKKFENYLTFDDGELKLLVQENPKGFLKNIEKPICLDEIQKVPHLLEYIKIDIDKNRKNGSFLLTGSANVLDNKEVKDTLAGRIIELDLFPLSLKEKNKKPNENIIDKLFKKDFKTLRREYYDELVQCILQGGYPEVLKFESSFEKSLWFSSYISTYIERDARDLGEIRDIDSFIKFVNIISTRSGTILKKSEISTTIGITDKTTENFLGILQKIYQGFLVKPYFENIGKQFVKSPKFYLSDTGVLTHILKIKTKEELLKSHYCGAVFETFVFNELLKHIKYFDDDIQIYHYRTNDKKEIDFILDNGFEKIAIEVKSSSNIKKENFKHIIDFQNRSKDKVLGIVFYTGENLIELDENLIALPMSFFM
ncbi:ATP-binding protein [Halarcobacter sp.]|uniref:ATP-binding protein n=1 Tax=Halarcobacter sp. TaxID=2321133 RepID=UPI002AABC887|nr:ATP-binding protein [Halarcobacter sp.]